ncbi:hypothetical protein Q0Z83_103420 [Actinoplanes sichuanensis]|uniref:Uncharacterized protein n=1 Tax=Actinoplanes sichuanensis TaxID=512349 RepID=A0ABW4AI05_9ACTN|nr:hypothetical protein [Actinoplanes sichuanensis]BEL12151.1 hypothetical protein Q0Z83_103420 [Actinoplanes sichuanensis]
MEFLPPSLPPRSPSAPSIERAFDALVSVVGEMQSTGRSMRSAGIKPRLVTMLGGFNEADYGFDKFRDFLNAAQKAGRVELRGAVSGPDLDVVLPERETAPVPSIRPVQSRIRADLWGTFMDWTPGISRVFDLDNGVARRVLPTDDDEMRELRRRIETSDGRFPKIEPVSLDLQLNWARKFLAVQNSASDREQLADALGTDRPLQEFTRLVRTMPIGPAWASFRNGKVADEVKKWAENNNVTLDPYAPLEPPTPTIRPASTTSLHPHGSGTVDIDAVRQTWHQLIDRMSIEELLALPITLGQFYRR